MASTTTSAAKSYSLLTHPIKHQTPISSLLSPNFFMPKQNPNFTLPRLRSYYHAPAWKRKRVNLVLAVSETAPEPESSDSNGDATIGIKLPRRSLLVQFTCDECGERTQRLINRLAYERGLVFVQCAGCLQHHKLVDNLGLVVEYDLREEISMDPNTD